MPARLLCVGTGVDHLQTRCAVLGSAGYDAKSAALLEAEILLRTEEFDLVIVSAWLSEWEKGKILATAAKHQPLCWPNLRSPTNCWVRWNACSLIEGMPFEDTSAWFFMN
jgi:hypothetical protein